MANGAENPAAARPASMRSGTPIAANPVGVFTSGVVISSVTLPTTDLEWRDIARTTRRDRSEEILEIVDAAPKNLYGQTFVFKPQGGAHVHR